MDYQNLSKSEANSEFIKLVVDERKLAVDSFKYKIRYQVNYLLGITSAILFNAAIGASYFERGSEFPHFILLFESVPIFFYLLSRNGKKKFVDADKNLTEKSYLQNFLKEKYNLTELELLLNEGAI